LATHFFAVLLAPAQFLAVAFLPVKQVPWRKLAVAGAVYLAAAACVATYVARHNVGQLYWVPSLSVTEIARLFVFFAGGPRGLAVALAVFSFALAIMATAFWVPQMRERGGTAWRLSLVLLWLVFPILAPALISFYKPVFVSRYLLISLPAYLILVGAAIARLRSLISTVALSLFLVMSVAGCWVRNQRSEEDWRGLVAY